MKDVQYKMQGKIFHGFRRQNESIPENLNAKAMTEKQMKEAEGINEFALGCLSYLNGDVNDAFRRFKISSEKGNPAGTIRLAAFYGEGELVPKDLLQYFKYLLIGVSQTHEMEKEGGARLNVLTEKELTEGEKILDGLYRAYPFNVKNLKKTAHYTLGIYYKMGKVEGVEIVKKDLGKAFDHFKLAADQNHVRAQEEIAKCYFYGIGTDKNFDQSLIYCKLAADSGCVNSQYTLASFFYYDGLVVKKDFGLAFHYMKLAAVSGHPEAEHTLGEYYFKGIGTAVDFSQANFYFKAAADKGNADSQIRIGAAYYGGKVLKQDYIEAFRYIKLAAEQGLPKAQVLLAHLYLTGLGTNKDLYQAAIYWRKAADQGDSEGQYKLACYLHNENNFVEANKYFQLSANQGHVKAKEQLLKNPIEPQVVERPKQEGVTLGSNPNILFKATSLEAAGPKTAASRPLLPPKKPQNVLEKSIVEAAEVFNTTASVMKRPLPKNPPKAGLLTAAAKKPSSAPSPQPTAPKVRSTDRVFKK